MFSFLARLIPFILLGVVLVIFFFGLLILTYVLAIGAIVGLVLFGVSLIQEKFFPSKQITKREPPQNKTGRTFDHKD